jgi:glutamate carboxypeptidase
MTAPVTVSGDWNRPVFARSREVAAPAGPARRCAALRCASLLNEEPGEVSCDGTFAAAARSPVLMGWALPGTTPTRLRKTCPLPGSSGEPGRPR